MSAYNPPYVRKTAAAAGSSGGGPAPEATDYHEPLMTMQGEYLVMMDGDIVMAQVPISSVIHNEIDTVVDIPGGTEVYYYEGESTPVDPDVGDRWYKPSDGVIYTYVQDGALLVWADL